MNFTDFDEAQGLTAEMVRAAYERLGYPLRDCSKFTVCAFLGNHTHHGKGDIDFAVPDSWDQDDNIRPRRMLDCGLQLAASIGDFSLQGLLRDINPRWRDRPSVAAFQAHGGWKAWWIVQHRNGCLEIVKLAEYNGAVWPTHDDGQVASSWNFQGCWPCHENGDRSRWPEREGMML